VLASGDFRLRTHGGLEHRQLIAAQTLTLGGRGADRAMVFDQQQVVTVVDNFSHIPLEASLFGEDRSPGGKVGGRHRLEVGIEVGEMGGVASGEDRLQRGVAKCLSHGAE